MRRQFISIIAILLVLIMVGVFYIDTSYARTLYWGARGQDVREIQSRLKQWGYYKGSLDGIFGKDTYDAVVRFQRKNGLKVDGVVGSRTKAALGIIEEATRKPTYSKDVAEAQRRLKQWGYYTGSVDGIYGPKTYNAVVKFQRKHGLKADGIIGPATRTALGITKAAASRSYSSTSKGVSRNDDVTLLAMAINGEARGEPYTGQVAVGAVILNRVRHPSFPNSIPGVIYQPLAFEAVDTGELYKPITNSAYKAARDALNGWDPTGGAIYFYNPATARSKWIWSLKPTLKIGRHVFAKR